jgi:hypothetical protein
VSNSDKAFFVKAYFEQAKLRIERLATLRTEKLVDLSFKDEAFTLCLVYIDSLASCYYGEANAKTFCRALRELSGNPLFGKLHPQVLLDPDNDKYWKNAADPRRAVEELIKKRPGEMFEETEIADIIRKSNMPQSQQEDLIGNLWRCSIGAICYSYMRSAAVHGFGTGPLSFSETLHDGNKGFRLDFDLLYAALQKIGDHVAQVSIEKGEWFGKSDYFKNR